MKPRKEAGLFAVLAEILRELPRIPDPACAQWPGLHDPGGEGEPVGQVRARHAAAVEVCLDCTALDACRARAKTERCEGGVIAGQLPVSADRGRPTKAIAA